MNFTLISMQPQIFPKQIGNFFMWKFLLRRKREVVSWIAHPSLRRTNVNHHTILVFFFLLEIHFEMDVHLVISVFTFCFPLLLLYYLSTITRTHPVSSTHLTLWIRNHLFFLNIFFCHFPWENGWKRFVR